MSDRDEFEAWVMSMDRVIAPNDGLTLARTDSRYESLAVELAWQAWYEKDRRMTGTLSWDLRA